MALKGLTLTAVVMALAFGGCSADSATNHERHREGGEHREGEESGTEVSLDQTYDKVRKGARLILAYDSKSNSFKGTVENTTKRTLKQVRVEVHLSNGRELGPTTPADLAPGHKRQITLKATSRDFKAWTAHPEVGSSEHGRGREGEGEHGRERRGEHDRERRGEHR